MNERLKQIAREMSANGFLEEPVDIDMLDSSELVDLMMSSMRGVKSFNTITSRMVLIYQHLFRVPREGSPLDIAFILNSLNAMFPADSVMYADNERVEHNALPDGWTETRMKKLKDMIINSRLDELEANSCSTFVEDGKDIMVIPVFLENIIIGFFALILKSGVKLRKTERQLAFILAFMISAAFEKRKYMQINENRDDLNILFEPKIGAVNIFAQNTEKIKMISQLIVGINHEINNPLAVIKGALYFIRNELAGEQANDVVQKNIERIEKAAEAISTSLKKLEKMKNEYHIKEYLEDISMIDINMFEEVNDD